MNEAESAELKELERRVHLVEKASGARASLGGPYHVTTYRGHRENKQGKTRAITIEVQVYGTGTYHVEASDEDGREAWGGHLPDLGEALNSVGWDDLDANPYPPDHRGSPGTH